MDQRDTFDVFYSYSHRDAELRRELDVHLALLRRQEAIRTWYDGEIPAGEEWSPELFEHLETADVVLLLISPDFIASDFCWSKEMTRAMERHEAGTARVIPVLLRPVDNWQTAPFGKLQALAPEGKAVTEVANRDVALCDVAKGIRQALEQEFRVRALGPESAGVAVPYVSEKNDSGEPTLLLTLAAASVLLYGVPDRNSRHPVSAALRPSTLRRQFRVVDVMRQVGVDSLISRRTAELVHLESPVAPEDGKGQKAKETWGVLFDQAAWALLNVHRDVLREYGIHLEDLYSWEPHALRRVLLGALFQLPTNVQIELWNRWRSSTDSRRGQVISLMAVNTHRPWLKGERASGEDLQQLNYRGEKSTQGGVKKPDESGRLDEKGKPDGSGMTIAAPLALLWFLDVAVGFYLPFGRSVSRQLGTSRKDSTDSSREPLSGAGWSFHGAPINAALAADDDRKLFPTGMMFLDPFSYSIALTTAPRIAACRELDDASPVDEEEWNLIKEAKVAFLGTRTSRALDQQRDFLNGIKDRSRKLHPSSSEELCNCIDTAQRKHNRRASWETGGAGLLSLAEADSLFKSADEVEMGSLEEALEASDFDLARKVAIKLGESKPAEGEKLLELIEIRRATGIDTKFGSLKKALENHDYSTAQDIVEELGKQGEAKPKLLELIRGLEAAAMTVHDDQLLLRIWTCYGYNRGRFWAAVSLWRGLGLMGQLIESHRRWRAEHKASGESTDVEAFVTERIVGVLHTHSLRGLVPGKDLGEPSHKGTLELAFSGWNTRGQRQAIRRLAFRLKSWLTHNEGLDISPLQESKQSSDRLRWSECFVRRLHGSAIVGSLWQWLDVENLEYQGRQYGQRRRYYWNAGVALTSWIRVLQRYFESAHELHWLLETCPLTSPFLSRTPTDPFLARLREKHYGELLECVQKDGAGQPGEESVPRQMRKAERFRAMTVDLQRLWQDDPQQGGPKLENDLKLKDDLKKVLGKLVDSPAFKAGGPICRKEWNEIAGGILKSLMEPQPSKAAVGGIEGRKKKNADWRSFFVHDRAEYKRIVEVANSVRRAVWGGDNAEAEITVQLKHYQDSLRESFNPRVSPQSRPRRSRESQGQGDDEENDLIDSRSACFEIASMIQQHWKVAAHASAASLFYQIPRVHRVDFFGRDAEPEPMKIQISDSFRVEVTRPTESTDSGPKDSEDTPTKGQGRKSDEKV